MDNVVREDEPSYAVKCFVAVCLGTLGKFLRFEHALAAVQNDANLQPLTGQRGAWNRRTQPCSKCWATCAKPRISALIHPALSKELHIPNRPKKIEHNLFFMIKFMRISAVVIPECSQVNLFMG